MRYLIKLLMVLDLLWGIPVSLFYSIKNAIVEGVNDG